MAKTAQALISDALRWLGVLQGEETAGASDMVQGLDTLNGMMAGFGTRGIAYAHTTLEATDTVNVPDEQIRNVMFLLAAELSVEYEVPLGDRRDKQVNDATNALQAAYYFPVAAATEPALRPRLFGRFSMTRLD